MVVHTFAPDHQPCFLSERGEAMGHALAYGARRLLNRAIPWPPLLSDLEQARFLCKQHRQHVQVLDMYLQVTVDVPNQLLENIYFDLPNYYATAARRKLARERTFSSDDLTCELQELFGDEDDGPATLGVLNLDTAIAADGELRAGQDATESKVNT
ncbi:hypothetical protein NUW54_g9003 [Trametes sanguinea]|uniref:Uncharacterized protein n=1 Tax=Trametes sanguinea TaxID=158606 RepID=A0ACC1PBM5_9APHY|nr:hypothetical protein NUW54_g9003 [Trametes sanguinea]